MKRDITSTRRKFLQGGALLATPVAAAIPAVALADAELKARVQHLEDEAAIRALQGSWLRQVNAGESGERLDHAVRSVIADQAGALDRIEIAPNARSAVGYFDYAVEVETPLDADCTLAQMAHVQGHGAVRRSERRLLRVDYVKAGDAWKIGEIAFQPLA